MGAAAYARLPADDQTPADDRSRNAAAGMKSRVQLDLAPRAMALLAELKDKTEATSYAEVIRNALKLYDGLLTEAERGAQFSVSYSNSPPAPFKMFL